MFWLQISEAHLKGDQILKKGEWTFLSNHGRVIAYIAKNPRSTSHIIANATNLSIPGVHRIISDLEKAGYVERSKNGRSNVYTVHPELPMRHHLESEYCVGDVLKAIGCKPAK